MQLTRFQTLHEEYPECDMGWECKDCTKAKRELEDNEESFNYLRDELEKLVIFLSSKDSYFDYSRANVALAGMCQELGVEFEAMTVTRSQAFKIQREQV